MTNKTQLEMVGWLKTQSLTEYSKYGRFAFRIATEPELVTTTIAGKQETTNTANVGDYILTGTQGEKYAIPAEMFKKRYEVVSDGIAKPSGKFYGCVYGGEFGDSFEFLAIWGENMVCNVGDMIGSPNPEVTECYRIERQAFLDTYK